MKRILRSFLLSILIVMALGTVVQAKMVYKYNYKAIATKQNTWYKPKGEEQSYKYINGDDINTYTNYRYKVTVPANYYMTLTLKGKRDYAILLYKALKGRPDDSIKWYYNNTDSSARSINIALPKGTYYFGTNYSKDGNGNLAFKYKLTKYVNKTNFKSSRAVTLGQGKKLAIVQLPGHNYERWYKIKLTKKKRIYVYGAKDIDLYDAKRQPLDVRSSNNSDNNIYYSYNKLNAGIYYIRVLGIRPRYYSGDTWLGSVEIVWWK